jgi:uncharacterized repeat protein (TIGR01451 family)
MKNKDSKRKPIDLSAIFGTYTPPPYLGKISKTVAGAIAAVKRTIEARRKIIGIVGASLVFAAILIPGIFVMLSLRPRLMGVGCRIEPPTPRSAEEDPVSPLRMRFSGSAARTENADKDVTAGITLTPPMEGAWKWEGDSVLVFTPRKDWPVGTKYAVQFADGFFPDHIRAKKSYSFETEAFSASIEQAEFYIDPENGKIKRVLATVAANYPIDPDSIEKAVTIKPNILSKSGSLDKRNYQYSISYDKLKRRAYVMSEPMGMPIDSVTVSISVRKGVRSPLGGDALREGLETTVTVPGSSDYIRVDEVVHDLVKTPEQRYDQVLVVSSNGTIGVEELSAGISAWVLPKDLPELPGLKAVKDYQWDDPQFVTEAILRLCEPLKLEHIPNELDYASVNSFRFNAKPGSYVFFRIKAGTKFFGDYTLKKEKRGIFRVKEYPREVSILSDGAIVSMTGSKQIAMLTREIDEVKFNVGRIRPDDINHLVSQSNGRLDAFELESYRFNEYNITEQYSSARKIARSGSGGVDYFSFDFSNYLNWIPEKNLRYGLFVFTVQGANESTEDYRDKRLIMVTDLGFYVKTNTDKTKDIFVQSIGRGNGVSDATVSVVGLNGNDLVSLVTGADGHVSIPDLSGFVREKQPTAYIVRKGEDLSFMPYSEEGRSLDYSNFDVGGITGATDPKTVNAFLFSDRGIYRPGDTVHVGIVVKAGDWRINLERTPLECSVVAPNGSEVFTRKIITGASGFEEIAFKTETYSPTGEYSVSLYLVTDEKKGTRKHLGSETVKVEEFLPDTLTIKANIDPTAATGWIHPDKVEGKVRLGNLFGTPAAGNDVTGQMSLFPGVQAFPKYRDYRFSDPYAKENSYKEFLGTIKTGDDGTCSFPIDLAKFEKATYRLRFYAEGFEKAGGRKVSAEDTVFVSPLDYLVGYKADGDLGYIKRDDKRTLSFIAINPALERCAVSDLTATLTEVRYVSMLVKQPNGVFKYQSIKKNYPVSENAFAIPAAGLVWEVPTSTEGDFELTLTGKGGLAYNKVSWSVIGEKNVERSLSRTAELEVKLDRQDYKNGDEIRLFIKAPYAGSGLITIERDKVYAHAWFRAESAASEQSIVVPADIEGNGYVTVSFVRSTSSKEIFMSPLCYASVPFSVSKEKRTNRIVFDLPDEIRSGNELTIGYTCSRPGKIAIYAVDEGILQVGRYKTPDPIAFFFKKRALEVGTSQILDLLLPEFDVLRSLGAMGGDGSMEDLNRNLNPFKRKRNEPVAFWSGIVDGGPERRTVKYRVPDYFNGTIRVMAVAVSDDTIGAAEQKVIARNPFIIAPSTPMMAAPGDEFDLPVTVTNNKKGSGENGSIVLEVVPSAHVTVLSQKSMTLAVPEGKDKTVTFRVKANDAPGSASLRFVASSGPDRVELVETLSVRPAVPYRVTIASGSVKRDKAEVKIARQVREEFATREISASYLPVGLAKGLYFYLEKYPYGCSEQVTSATWPLLYPALTSDLGIDAAAAKETVDRTISILQARLRSDGTIGVWTSASESELWLTNYCTLFLIDARSKGFYVPDSLMNSCLSGLRTIATDAGTDAYSIANRAFAIYILTRSEIVTTAYIEKLRADMKKAPDSETGCAGIFLAGTYALLKKDLEGSMLIGKISRQLKKDDSFKYVDSLCYLSIYLDVVARHFPSRLNAVSADILADMADQLKDQKYTSLSANHALMAIESYLSRAPAPETGSVALSEIRDGGPSSPIQASGNKLLTAAYSAKAKTVEIDNRAGMSLFWQVTTAGFDLELPKAETKEGIEVYREFCDAQGNKLTSARIGDEILVRLNVRTTGKKTVTDVALVDMLPAGLECDINSIRVPGGKTNWEPSYVDIREDRVVFFGALRSELKTFEYRARAVNAGTFTVPPLFAEAMYDKKTWAIRPQEPLTIKSK